MNVSVSLSVNGHPYDLDVDGRKSLLDLLREQLGLTGAKKGCDHGQCGACTVHVDGKPHLSCLQFAAQLDGRDVLTIEGISSEEGRLHPLQDAFIRTDAMQGGFCTSGQIMSGLALLRDYPRATVADMRELMSGNLCRCGAHDNIINALKAVADASV